MAKKEQFTKEEHKRAKREAQEIASKIKVTKEYMRTAKALDSNYESKLGYYDLVFQKLQKIEGVEKNILSDTEIIINDLSEEISKVKDDKRDWDYPRWEMAQEMRLRKESGNYNTYRDAYRYAEKNYTLFGKSVTFYQLEKAWHKKKCEDGIK